MDTYKILFSEDTQIGAAYDEFHHELAHISKVDDDLKLIFRSSDYNASLKFDEDSYSIDDLNMEIKIYKDGPKTLAHVNGKDLEIDEDSFKLNIADGLFEYEISNKDDITLKTDSDEIVVALSLGLLLIAYLNNIR